MYRSLYMQDGDAVPRCMLREVDDAELLRETADGDVELDLEWSTLNYKDALAITGRAPVVRRWPMVPGIDGAGTVTASRHPAFAPGDAVVLNGWGVGEAHWGCLARKARVKGDWLVPLPAGLSARQAMAIGTAGYTAMLCALALRGHGLAPGDGEVLVTGAAGGVGSLAITILAGWGFRVVATTGRMDEAPYLKALGAADVMDRAALGAPGKPLQKERWSGVVDVVGSHTLANACAQTRYGGVVAACGLAQGMDLPLTVAPFILRGVTLTGIDSVMCPHPRRLAAWTRLAADLDLSRLDTATSETDLPGAIDAAPRLLAGEIRGRLVVDVSR